MGQKGDKMTSASTVLAERLIAVFDSIGGITHKKMFGGYGFFFDGKMFGIVDSKGKAFLKVDEDLKAKYVARGAEQHSRMPYYSLPENVLENEADIIEWARKSIELVG